MFKWALMLSYYDMVDEESTAASKRRGHLIGLRLYTVLVGVRFRDQSCCERRSTRQKFSTYLISSGYLSLG